jgi:tRNA dimethylallyltransferase
MYASGLIEETRAILASPRGPALRALRAIGYDEAALLLEGDLDRGAAEARTTLRTIQMAKRQRTWFRHRVRARDVAADGAAAAILKELPSS